MIPRSNQSGDLDLLFDYAAMRLNGQKAEGKSMKLNCHFTDTNQRYILELENEALSHIAGRQARDADATVTLTRAKLNDVLLGQTTFEKELDAGNISVAGNAAALNDLLSMLDSFDFWFNIGRQMKWPSSRCVSAAPRSPASPIYSNMLTACLGVSN
jgi:alkyl sulfatase BDS1-like metallo-beta-lactamase superfamily hydrolase